jgi:hypothetical protein
MGESMTKNSLKDAPYDSNGNLLGYASPYGGDVHWEPNEPTIRTLTYHGFTRGMSSAKIHWRDEEGHNFPMFLAELDDLLSNWQVAGLQSVDHGTDALTITAQWVVRKRGQNYGIALHWS